MIETFFDDEHAHSRLQEGPLGPFVEQLASWLANEGYGKAYGRRALRGAAGFSKWVGDQGIPVGNVSAATVAQYVDGLAAEFRGRGRCRRHIGVAHLLRFLGREVETGPEFPRSPLDEWLGSYDSFLDRVRGLTSGTRKNRVAIARRFVVAHLESEPAWDRVTPEAVISFVKQEATVRKGSVGGIVVGVRSMLKYLVVRGFVSAEIVGVVPSIRRWRHASLPRYLTAEELSRVLEVCGKDAICARDHAIMLVLARLGLRAIEVARLRLEDIAWREGELRVSASKTARGRVLPVSHDVGAALVAYLQGDRPETGLREVFIRKVRPFRALTSAAVTGIARRCLRSAGISMSRLGAHVLRHSAATQMVRRGVSFKEVADVLGHKDLATTGVYAKVDLGALTRVAMPWPGDGR